MKNPDATAEAAIPAWTAFLEKAAALSDKLRHDVESVHNDISALTSDLGKQFVSPSHWTFQAARIQSLEELFGPGARLVLLEPLDAYARLELGDRLPRAFHEFRSALRSAARKLPVRTETSARTLIESAPAPIRRSWRLRLTGYLDRERPILLRAAVLQELGTDGGVDSRTEGRLYMIQAQAALALLDPWQSLRYHAFRQIRGEPGDDERLERARDHWKQQATRRGSAAVQAAEALRKALSLLPSRLTEAAVTEPRRSSTSPRSRALRQRHEAYWSRQSNAVRSQVGIERSILELGAAGIQLAREFTESANAERESVRRELVEVLAALRGWRAGQPNPLAAGTARLTTAAERAEQWVAALQGRLESLLPEQVESLEPRRSLPPWRSPWHRLEPRQMFLEAASTCREEAVEAFSNLEMLHGAVIREIERAREVVIFGIETAQREPDSAGRIAEESVENAILLLEHEQAEMDRDEESCEGGIVTATMSSFYQFHLAFEQGTLSLASHLAREGGYRAFKKATEISAEWVRYAGKEAGTLLRRAYRWFLIWIGWEAPVESGLVSVERWHYLSQDFAIDLKPRHLPLIYNRLFRIEPVEDPKFLIGRELEISAIAEARQQWETGRLASVLVIGERGSGKTSLLNCGVNQLFAEADVVRSRFTDRILSAEDMRRFLATQLGFQTGEDLVGRMRSKRRVIVLEEVERTFLRVVGGTEALRELLRIVAATSASDFWFLSMSSAAFRLLAASDGVGRYFSHRINASAVEPDEMHRAILQRHHLSGLRLRFAASQASDSLDGWIRRRIRRNEDPETTFFNRLYVHSGGIFRSGFGLWLKHIDRAEQGILYMKKAEEPEYAALIRGLARDDLFTLQAILQHGSLTAEEHARIFDCPLELSHAHLGHLTGHEIIEPEPEAPGYRVRPEGGTLVRSALGAENLI